MKKIILFITTIMFVNSEIIVANEIGKYLSQNGSLLLKKSGKIFIDYGSSTCIGEFAGKIVKHNRNILTIKSIADKQSKCTVQLKLYEKSLRLEEKNCAYYHGDSCNFNGIYTKEENGIESSVLKNDKSLIILKGADSDRVEVIVQAQNESCSISIKKIGKIINTTCLSFKNSKNVPIFCTQHKQICKTKQEVINKVFSTSHIKIEARRENFSSLKNISNTVTWESLGIGIINPGEISDWTYFSAKTPKEALEWINALKPLGKKISYSLNARIWTQAGYSVEEVKKWVLLGIDSPRYVKAWRDAGVKIADDVSRWKKLGFNDVNEVKLWIYTAVTRPEDANAWINVGILSGKDLSKWQNAGIDTPQVFKTYKSIGKTDYSEIKEWNNAGIKTAKDIMQWGDINVTSSQVAFDWIQAGVESSDEVKEWKSMGLDNPRECARLKRLKLTTEDAKIWLEDSFTLSEIESELRRGNYSPSEARLAGYKNMFWLIVIVIIGFLIYRVLRLKCPSCKSREFTKIDENRHSKGYEQYSKKDNMYTKLKGLSDRRGRYEKVYEVFDITTTYKCDKCNEVFKNATIVKEKV